MCTVVCTLVRLGSGKRRVRTCTPQTCCRLPSEADPEVSVGAHRPASHWGGDLDKRLGSHKRAWVGGEVPGRGRGRVPPAEGSGGSWLNQSPIPTPHWNCFLSVVFQNKEIMFCLSEGSLRRRWPGRRGVSATCVTLRVPPNLSLLCVWGAHRAPFTGLLVLVTAGGRSLLLPPGASVPLVWAHRRVWGSCSQPPHDGKMKEPLLR